MVKISKFISWTAIASAIFAAIGFILSSVLHSMIEKGDKIDIEIWKIKQGIIEKRLSEFYYPLNASLIRDDLIWKKVFGDLKPGETAKRPQWVTHISNEEQQTLRGKIETEIILNNHKEATQIIRTKMHLADADHRLQELLYLYMRHVDIYITMRSAGITNLDPADMGEPYPEGLGEAVRAKLTAIESEYQLLLSKRGLTSAFTFTEAHPTARPHSPAPPAPR